jgi:hypothetical protein
MIADEIRKRIDYEMRKLRHVTVIATPESKRAAEMAIEPTLTRLRQMLRDVERNAA